MALSPWKLESFLDSLILELDRAQDTLSLKGMTRKLTYTVKDIGLDLHIFPEFKDGQIYFKNAKPGDQGASRISFQLGSITDRQIRETTTDPIGKDDISIESVEGLEPEVKQSLQKIGVKSTRDLEKLEERNVDLEKAVNEKSDKKVNYNELANLIQSARRRKLAPALSRIQTQRNGDQLEVRLEGANLMLSPQAQYPYGAFNQAPVAFTQAEDKVLSFSVPYAQVNSGQNQLKLALDPYAVIELNLNQGEG